MAISFLYISVVTAYDNTMCGHLLIMGTLANARPCFGLQWTGLDERRLTRCDRMLHHHCRRNPELQEELQIQAAVAAGDVLTVRKMLERGYSPNIRDANGWTLLHFSAARGKERCVRVFLEHGGRLPSRGGGVRDETRRWAYPRCCRSSAAVGPLSKTPHYSRGCWPLLSLISKFALDESVT